MKKDSLLDKFVAGFLSLPYGDLSDRWEACNVDFYGKRIDNPYERNDMPIPFVEDIHIDINENYHMRRLQ
ncbi:MAG: hypothetical protein K5851_02270 [Lachnospiraceae bacterium]|nr:hypothetical protein [Lachnospiraceae bacterium]